MPDSPENVNRVPPGASSVMTCSGFSQNEAALIAELRRHGGELSAANLGNCLKQPTGGASNPGTLAATSVLRSLERRGIVARRYVSGRGYGRTLWHLCPNTAMSQPGGQT